ncbi:SGNH/GDSL hydrolase family protein [Glacieibacterium megasporae]|uniref:SGNH/GDSL hydrolase family protein n=1 Tax=Glacieibacterium megasporae TaxID=2835787 RepID=UPI001C1E12E7|nr:SGNH/GDSL hydrolase family protein [Polymorphobacter megasporae]UAJ09939.1 SGNH/GDSL hydrolase family protein [Polymorphobacter megasporae]
MKLTWLLASILLSTPALAAPADVARSEWSASWAASQLAVEPANALPSDDSIDITLRQTIRLSVGGPRLRVRLSNAFGTQPLIIDTVRVALAGKGSAIISSSQKPALFGGKSSVMIPAGADYWSDPIDMSTPALARLAISLHLDAAPTVQTGHPGSRATSYIAHGTHSDDSELADAKPVEHWYQIAGVDVAAPAKSSTIVAFGDSITDGHGATTDGDDRWPDVLAARLQASAAGRQTGVVNGGIGGNHLLTDGLGPNALARFDRDVLSQAGVRFVIMLEGINDIGGATREHAISAEAHSTLVARLIDAYAQMIERARAHGIRMIGATILPFVGSDYYHPGPETEADRAAVNRWIRTPGHFDAVIDFDRVARDPAHPDRMLAQYDSGDHLHPSAIGYRAMANAVPLEYFSR